MNDESPVTIDLISHEDYSFTLGEKFDENFPVPVKFKADPNTGERIYWPTLLLPEPVFDSRFLQVLKDSEVEPFQEFDVKITGKTIKGEKAPDTYKAINILNIIDCFDREQSLYEETEGMIFMDKLVLDTKKIKRNKMFRVKHLAEYIIVSQDVAKNIDKKTFPDVVLIPVMHC